MQEAVAHPEAISPAFSVRDDAGGRVLALAGDWTAATVGEIDAPLRELIGHLGPDPAVDVSGLGRMDVAGAWLVVRTFGAAGDPIAVRGDHANAQRLISVAQAAAHDDVPHPDRLHGVVAVFDRIGHALVNARHEALGTLEFLGLTIVTLLRQLRHPQRIRWISVVSVMETAGLNAMPIIMLLSFFIGVVVAFLGARILGDFGAAVFTVELVAFSVMREFGVVITCVLLAGRTDSAFTAQIGAMKMRQEIDAMRVLGLDPMEAIVVPRLIAMLVMTPILTFAAIVAGLAGGLIVCWAMLNVSPIMFFTRISEAVPAQHFWVGMLKAPPLAVVLALVGCRQGLETDNDVTSLGQRVTASVVHAIFLVIVLDAAFAIWFLEMDW
ncbi:MAG: MlaE family lipid ABC transporter permease subunit [Hyphomonadaceae bacterium]|nr:MlaE family lipid ABC transporter permease subunit [Hyphomonadaceae bacterium]